MTGDRSITMSKTCKPIIALINPKSGGRQGLDVINELQWILNPRQVFDLTSFSPNHIFKFYKNVENLQILVGGGDGTVNWILRTVESIHSSEGDPPIAVMPLGTGNDLARELNWGTSYNSIYHISRILTDMANGTIIPIDIWRISSHSFLQKKMSSQTSSQSEYASKLPLDSFNNYFSIGSDAATALEFHLDREKNPARYNSRIKNKLCYVEIGGKDLWKREYKNLADNIFLKCDGISYKSRIEELRPHCILFLNISNYGAGTNPWGKYSVSSEFTAQSINDGILEVIGLSAATLATLHIGGQGDRICQCRCAEMNILRETPIQIDGEPVLIQPCTINISHKKKYPFIKRECRK